MPTSSFPLFKLHCLLLALPLAQTFPSWEFTPTLPNTLSFFLQVLQALPFSAYWSHQTHRARDSKSTKAWLSPNIEIPRAEQALGNSILCLQILFFFSEKSCLDNSYTPLALGSVSRRSHLWYPKQGWLYIIEESSPHCPWQNLRIWALAVAGRWLA